MNWLSVDDRLPEEGQIVLIYEEQHVWFGYYGGCGKWYWLTDDLISTGVTHWQELPEGPK